MKKIPTLFVRDQMTRMVIPDVNPGCEWVLAGEGVATRQYDGTCCLVYEGRLYKRYELKHGKMPPAGFFPAQEDLDPVTGDQPGWIAVGEGPEDKYHREGWAGLLALQEHMPVYCFANATYELVGPKIQGNPERLGRHTLILHGIHVLDDAPRDFAGLRDYLASHDIEGIVWWHPDGRKAKIKGRDYGLKRPSLDKQAV